MKITNKLNLPEEIVKAVSVYEPSGNYSASMLTKSPRMVWLGRRHFAEIEEDVTDRIWSIFGTAVHKVLQAAGDASALNEEYLKHEFSDGTIISGMADVYKNKKISDWKVSSVWSLIYMDEAKLFEYESQLNTYAFLFRKYGFEVESLEIVMLLRDWQKSKAKYDQNYPQEQIARIDIPLWNADQAEGYIMAAIENFEKYKETPDNDLPECTPAERWAKPGKWALMKTGRKSAVKLYDTKPDIDIEAGHYWEERKGEMFKRCEYCSASAFCNQYQDRAE